MKASEIGYDKTDFLKHINALQQDLADAKEYIVHLECFPGPVYQEAKNRFEAGTKEYEKLLQK